MKIITFIAILILSVSISNNLEAQNKEQSKKIPKWLNTQCQDSIAGLNQIIDSLYKKNIVLNDKISELKTENAYLKKDLLDEKASSQIDKFLNLQDVSIFNTNFLQLDEKKIHPSRKNYYMLIEAIHDLNDLLVTGSNEDLIAQLTKVKNNLEKARQKIKVINAFAEFDFLSEPQKQYFRQLVDRYNELNRTVNPQGN